MKAAQEQKLAALANAACRFRNPHPPLFRRADVQSCDGYRKISRVPAVVHRRADQQQIEERPRCRCIDRLQNVPRKIFLTRAFHQAARRSKSNSSGPDAPTCITNGLFKDLKEEQCQIDFYVDFSLKTKLFESLVDQFFHKALVKMINAFEGRAVEVYGAPRKH